MTLPNLLLVLLLQVEWYKVLDTGAVGQAPIKQTKIKPNSLASLFNLYGKCPLEQ